ncbi:Cof-type HAD-IIB family hydrolase [Mycoplasma sp. NEAQ87857]|uniref:YcsE-related riboflavin metabolism phosphatase n=1 Tax=Mycoplasma sp. NEAQ87857 TaxID=2683967 RepID=UPI001317F0D8|nr:HAD family hydrolase [Mycoplasma sp. NEAQ87857]QGZ97676.1 Cof-type HAD-IIB family hydrolase [Mycoplasma sp. NEAQ87857]
MKNLKDIIKIAAFDVDGTILPNGYTTFSPNTKKMFELLKQNNITTVISTAREFATIGDFLEQLKYVDYFIGANGSFIWDVKKQDFMFKATLIKEEVVQLYERFENQISAFSVTDFDTVYKSPTMQPTSWFAKPFAENYKDFNEAYLSRNNLYVITINCSNPKELSQLMAEYIQEHNLQMEISSYWSKGFFISPIGITKSHTLQVLCDKLNLSMDNLIAFGDSSNDFEMLRDAVYGVAMQRASSKLKAVAKDIALDCEYDGAYLKLKELGLI